MIGFKHAGPEDKAEIIAISKKIWDGHDYVSTVYDKWVADIDGFFVCVTYDSAIAGFAKVSMHGDNDAWLEGLRVDPSKRGLGLGKQLTRYCIERCLNRHIENIRLSTYIGNHESIGIIESHGFKRVAEYKALFRPINPCEATPACYQTLSDPSLVEAALSGEALGEFYGYASFDFTFEKITPRLLKGLVSEGAVYGLCIDGRIQGMAIASTRHSKVSALFLSYIQGEEHYSALIDAAIARAESLMVEEIIAMCPKNTALRDSLVNKGFGEWDDHDTNIFLYEYVGK